MLSDEKPLIAQGDGSLLLDVHKNSFTTARGEISVYAELEKSPEHFHTYKISNISLWNAAGADWTADKVLRSIKKWSLYQVPQSLITQINEAFSRWGKLKLMAPVESHNATVPASGQFLHLEIEDPQIREELLSRKGLSKWLIPAGDHFMINLVNRGTVKAELMKIDFPVLDLAPMRDGKPLDIKLRESTQSGKSFEIRDYQKSAVHAFLGTGEPGTGFGTVVMPCGSGKTIVGINIMAELSCQTLILTTNVAAVHQWCNELLDKTWLKDDQIAEYTGDKKLTGPVTIATYQILTWRKHKTSEYPHFDLFRNNPWGLIIYDEVHLLPAPVFRVTAELQAIRRLGLTATLVREDGAERDVFPLVGPKRFDIPWKDLESLGWIAQAHCQEIRVDLPNDKRIPYAMASKRDKLRIAAENPTKLDIAMQIIKNRHEDHILVIGQYISQLEEIAKKLNAKIITGKTPNPEREEIYNAFREGKERIIVVSKVANFAIDLPDASVAIQLSGTFGSRQEEAQRLGRLLRPKKRDSWFYSIISRGTVEADFAINRQRFLAEQGYQYTIDIWDPSEVSIE